MGLLIKSANFDRAPPTSCQFRMYPRPLHPVASQFHASKSKSSIPFSRKTPFVSSEAPKFRLTLPDAPDIPVQLMF